MTLEKAGQAGQADQTTFTEEDVEVLLQLADWISGMDEGGYEAEQCQTLISIADRILALLPAEEDSPAPPPDDPPSTVSDAAINAANTYHLPLEECEGVSGFDPDW